jgi:thioredoxin-dependent peroxiredoxin
MLNTGSPAPPFELPDDSMEMIKLSSFRGKKNVVLYFYPKDDTPGCTIQAIDFSDHEADFAKHDTVVFGISRDDVLSHAAFRDKHGLSVVLLSDSEDEVCRKYDVVEDRQVDGTVRCCFNRSTFIIDKEGVLRHVLCNVSPREHAHEVLKLVRQIN